MEIFSNGFGLLATILGVVGLAGGAAGYFKASRGDSIIKYQAIEIDGLRRKISDMEKEKSAADATALAKDETIQKQNDQIQFLQKMKQGSPELKKLAAAIENNTKILTEFIGKKGK